MRLVVHNINICSISYNMPSFESIGIRLGGKMEGRGKSIEKRRGVL